MQKIIRKRPKHKLYTESESEDSESKSAQIVYADSPDSNVDENEETENTATKKNVALETEKYYAVYYEHKYYIGRIVLSLEEESHVKFLTEIMENSFVWPKKPDEDCVKNNFVFYGPIKLHGNEPFSFSTDGILKIKTVYRLFKQNKY